MSRLTRRRAGALLGMLVVASAAVRAAAAREVPSPFGADEMIYGLLGRALWSGDGLSILGADTPFYSLLYPALAGGPLSLGDTSLGFSLLQVLQAVLVSSTAVVVYLWGTSLMSRGWALAAAALSLTPPALAYAGLVMTEVLFLPVMTVAAWALARALERPTAGRQALFGLAVVAAALTRVQAVVLVAVALTAVVLAALLTRDRGLPRRFLPTFGVLAGLALGWSAWQLRDGGPWTKVLGGYAGVSGSYDAGEAARFVVWHAADVFLLVAGVPLLALGVLTVEAIRRRLSEPAASGFVAIALSMTGWLVLEAGVFASRHVGHLAERYLLATPPLLCLALALWLARGAPRPQPATTLVALAVATPAVLLPIERFAIPEATQDALTTVPLRRLADSAGTSTLELAWLAGVVLATLAFLFVPRRVAPVLAAGVGLALAAASVVASDELGRVSRERDTRFFAGADERWIDAAARGPVTLLYDGSAYWTGVWHQVFWNERVRSVVYVGGTTVPGPLPQRPVAPRFDGLLFDASGQPIANRLVVAPATFRLRGQRLARVSHVGVDRAGLALWRTGGPPRVAMWTTGVRANGDFSAARVRVFSCEPGRLELTLLRKDERPVELFADGRPAGRVSFDGNSFWNGSIASPPGADGGGRCDFDLVSSGLAGSTRIEYVES